MLTLVEHGSPAYDRALRALADRGDDDLDRVTPAVREILDAVRTRGDAALREYAARFDGGAPERMAYDREDCARALRELDPSLAAVLRQSAERIRAYHAKQVEEGRRFTDDDGVTLGWRVRPLERVGVYAPGGKARYPSSVLMSAVPARVAGVREVLLATPRPTTELLAAAALAEVDAVYDVGGAQAIAAMAYGTETVPRVDKIVGPGNLYVACAKKLVFGRVAIDGIAGPSEILVVADDGADPAVAAADLLSQAEHDEDAYPLLLTDSRAMAERVSAEVARQLETLPRRAIAEASVRAHGQALVAGSLEEAARVATVIASEHLALLVREPEAVFATIGAAGAAFLGDWTPEAAGDYLAGPSHVLPTGGAVRFSSPLGVYDFVVRTSVIAYDRAALSKHAGSITAFARAEGLEAHARAVERRGA
ncbi:MAG: histidinol dehydrogenase [Polyangiales bacterium]